MPGSLFTHIAHNQMSDTYGESWLLESTAAPLNDFSRSMINEAKAAIKDEVTSGKVVAELKFAFWVGLIAPQYDNTLWRAALHKSFRATGGKKRSVVHGRLNAIRRFRNRVAHHEPIFHLPVADLHSETREAIGWMCRDTETWSRAMSRVEQVLIL